MSKKKHYLVQIGIKTIYEMEVYASSEEEALSLGRDLVGDETFSDKDEIEAETFAEEVGP
jgi:hypothetical protein